MTEVIQNMVDSSGKGWSLDIGTDQNLEELFGCSPCNEDPMEVHIDYIHKNKAARLSIPVVEYKSKTHHRNNGKYLQRPIKIRSTP